jgi:hypothetical protein
MSKRTITTAILAAAVAAVAAGTAQAEVYKCKGPNGKLTFSDKPCPGQATEEVAVEFVEPSAEQRLDAAEAAASHQRMAKERDAKKAEQARQDSMASIRNSISRMQAARDRELAALRAKKARAANNLAGAAWEQSISQEMEAVTQRYAADIQAARDRLSELRASR